MKLKKREHIYIAFLAVFGLLAILSFASSIVKIKIDELIFSESHLLSIVGIIVSTVGLICTVYFVVLTISTHKIKEEIANVQNKCNEINDQKEKLSLDIYKLGEQKETLSSDIGELNKTKDEIQKALGGLQLQICELNKSTDEYKNNQRDYAQYLYDGLDAQIAFAEQLSTSSKSKSTKIRNNLVRTQAKMSYQFPMLDKEIRLKLLRELASLGDANDMLALNNIICNPNEDIDIKNTSKCVLEELKNNLKNKENKNDET